jgi:hypothetical protein
VVEAALAETLKVAQMRCMPTLEALVLAQQVELDLAAEAEAAVATLRGYYQMAAG